MCCFRADPMLCLLRVGMVAKWSETGGGDTEIVQNGDHLRACKKMQRFKRFWAQIAAYFFSPRELFPKGMDSQEARLGIDGHIPLCAMPCKYRPAASNTLVF